MGITREKLKKVTWKNVTAYLIGNIRYRLYYDRRLSWLLREHIREQIGFRIKNMDIECYQAGECKMCGCQTTHLQMANKACDKPCYPAMMDKYSWISFRMGMLVFDENGAWKYSMSEDKLYFHRLTNYSKKEKDNFKRQQYDLDRDL